MRFLGARTAAVLNVVSSLKHSSSVMPILSCFVATRFSRGISKRSAASHSCAAQRVKRVGRMRPQYINSKTACKTSGCTPGTSIIVRASLKRAPDWNMAWKTGLDGKRPTHPHATPPTVKWSDKHPTRLHCSPRRRRHHIL